MTQPTQGKFASEGDVTGAFEGEIPAARLPWVNRRIGMVERELMFQVPSLRKSVELINAESIAAGDPDRVERIKDIVANKVLDLYRNPDGASQRSITTPDITTARGWYAADPTRGKVEFSVSELSRARLVKAKRRFGTITVAPPGFVTQ